MLARRQTWIRLETLRRSARLTVFALAIILLRVGIVATCAPSDISEIAHATEHALFADASHNDDGDDDRPCGDCLHSGCHLAVTLPVMSETSSIALNVAPVEPPLLARSSAPPDLSLRPPIV